MKVKVKETYKDMEFDRQLQKGWIIPGIEEPREMSEERIKKLEELNLVERIDEPTKKEEPKREPIEEPKEEIKEAVIPTANVKKAIKNKKK